VTLGLLTGYVFDKMKPVNSEKDEEVEDLISKEPTTFDVWGKSKTS
jgi:hypothetical protein